MERRLSQSNQIQWQNEDMVDGDAIFPLTSNGTSCKKIFDAGIVNEASNLICDSYKNAEEISNLSFSKESVLVMHMILIFSMSMLLILKLGGNGSSRVLIGFL